MEAGLAVESFGAGKCQKERREGVETRREVGLASGRYLLRCCWEAVVILPW